MSRTFLEGVGGGGECKLPVTSLEGSQTGISKLEKNQKFQEGINNFGVQRTLGGIVFWISEGKEGGRGFKMFMLPMVRYGYIE